MGEVSVFSPKSGSKPNKVARELQWRSQEFDWGGVYVLTSHCNFKTCVSVPHVSKTITTDIPPVATPLVSSMGSNTRFKQRTESQWFIRFERQLSISTRGENRFSHVYRFIGYSQEIRIAAQSCVLLTNWIFFPEVTRTRGSTIEIIHYQSIKLYSTKNRTRISRRWKTAFLYTS